MVRVGIRELSKASTFCARKISVSEKYKSGAPTENKTKVQATAPESSKISVLDHQSGSFAPAARDWLVEKGGQVLLRMMASRLSSGHVSID